VQKKMHYDLISCLKWLIVAFPVELAGKKLNSIQLFPRQNGQENFPMVKQIIKLRMPTWSFSRSRSCSCSQADKWKSTLTFHVMFGTKIILFFLQRFQQSFSLEPT